MYKETIQLIIENIQKGMDKIPSYANEYRKLGVGIRQVQGQIQMFNVASGQIMKTQGAMALATQNAHKSYDGFGKAMKMSMPMYKNLYESGFRMNTFGGKFAMTLRSLTHGARGFRMELLSVMFFGQALMRTFTGLLQPAMEVFGIFDLFRILLQVMFIPVMEMLFPIIMQVVEWFINLSDDTKKWIGILVILGAILGFILMAIGMLGLGLGGIISFISNITEIIENLFGPTIGAGMNLMLLGAGFGFVGKMITWLEPIIGPIIDKIKEKFNDLGLGGKILEMLGIQVKEGEKPWDALKAKISSVIGDILKKLGFSSEEIETWKGGFEIALDSIKTSFEDMVIALTDPENGLIPKLKDLATQIGDMLPDIKTIIDFLSNLIDKINTAIETLRRWKTISDKYAAPTLRIRTPTEVVTKAAGAALDVISTGGAGGGAGDFIWRPGSAPQPFSAADTIIGTKSGGMGGVVINQTLNINVSNADQMQRMIADSNSRLVDDLRRITKGAV